MDLEQIAASLSGTKESSLKRISSLVKQMDVVQRRVMDIENELKQAKEQLRDIEENLLPAAFVEAGVSEFTTEDGVKVAVSPFYAVSIPKDRTDEAYDWLREHGFGDLVKNVVSVTFGRQEDDEALKLMDALTTRGYSTGQKQWVEPMTLKAFVREQLESGRDIPSELFGVYSGSKAKIVLKKGRA